MELSSPIIADTDYLSDYLAGTKLAKRFTYTLLQDGKFVVTTAITVSELYFGKYRRKWQEKRSKTLQTLITSLTVIPFALKHAEIYGEIRARLVDEGMDIGFADTAIASIALVENIPVLTANFKHFDRVRGLVTRNYVHNDK